MKKPSLVILTGPTAVGKTKLSILLAEKIGGEIISADSMQVYRHMDIGSAKIRSEEMQGIKHHLIDVLEPNETFDVVTFQSMAKECLTAIYESGKIPIVTGGTGFYIQALLYDIQFDVQSPSEDYRLSLQQLAVQKGNEYLHELLQEKDEESALMIHPSNVRRVIRALEYYHLTGEKISEHNKREREKESPYNFGYFVLNDERSQIYENINQRVDAMIASGLVEEVKELIKMGCHSNMVSMQGLGYKEIASYLDGTITLEDAITLIKRDTRHFAKRQLTWFKREKEVTWVNKQDFSYQDEKILDFLCTNLKERNIL